MVLARAAGYTLLRREMPPQGRFNAGQKANAIIVAAMAVGFLVTGSLLLAGPHVPAWLVSRALLLHQVLAVAAVALFVGHLLHGLLDPARSGLSARHDRRHHERNGRSRASREVVEAAEGIGLPVFRWDEEKGHRLTKIYAPLPILKVEERLELIAAQKEKWSSI